MSEKNGGYAFPGVKKERKTRFGNLDVTEDGMTLRDYFAAKAMQGDWASQSEEVGTFINAVTDQTLEARARVFYRMADAMLRAREE
ncbi:TPA: hypothetical protein IB053_002414 [Escherichia coli]|nr:hypothetical protein [Escherichia coli]